MKLVKSLQPMGLSTSTINKLKWTDSIDAKLEGPGFGEMFNVSSSTVAWFNNIEEDAKYSEFPSGYGALLRYYQSGQLAEIRRNAFNALYAIRLSDPQQLRIFIDTFMYIKRRVCIRFGMVPIFKSNSDQDLDYTIAMCINYLRLKNKRWLLIVKNFLEELSGNKVIDIELISTTFAKWAKTTMVLAMQDLDLLSSMDSVIGFNRRIAGSIESTGALFMNGEYLKLSEVTFTLRYTKV